MSAEPRVLERRQARQQDLPRLARVARERQRALEDVTRRQHAELVAELSRTAAAVEHRHDRRDVEPGVVLEAAEEAWQTGPAAEAADVHSPKTHAVNCNEASPQPPSDRLAARRRIFVTKRPLRG